MNQQWMDLAKELEYENYRFSQPVNLTLQIIYPDGMKSRVVSKSKESEVLEILERAYSHMNMCQVLKDNGYQLHRGGPSWYKDEQLFKDFRYAWLHYDERNYDVS